MCMYFTKGINQNGTNLFKQCNVPNSIQGRVIDIKCGINFFLRTFK